MEFTLLLINRQRIQMKVTKVFMGRLNRFTLVCTCLIVSTVCVKAQSAQNELDIFFNEVDHFTEMYVKKGKVDYESAKNSFDKLIALKKRIKNISIASASDTEKKAFYINAYNILVIYNVVKLYPVSSPNKENGFFDKVKYEVAGEALTLNALEIKKLLMPSRDPRIHFVLTCAAKGCPKLASFAYRPSNLDQVLDDRTIITLNDQNFIKYNTDLNRVELSKIFQWYKRDFERNGHTVLSFINQYREKHIADDAQIAYYEYDWSLNSQ